MVDQSETMSVKPGTLDTALDLEPVAHIWTSSARSWGRVPEGVLVEESLECGALAAGEQSSYLDYLYSTALVEAVSGDLRLMYVPVDHVGDRQATPGYYTYALRPAPVGWPMSGVPDVKWVRIELIEDAAPD